jgi:hypothetical protein
MLAMLLIVMICVGNLALGFAIAVCLGKGPAWTEHLLPAKIRDRLGLVVNRDHAAIG